jgi:hypothetical protein
VLGVVMSVTVADAVRVSTPLVIVDEERVTFVDVESGMGADGRPNA